MAPDALVDLSTAVAIIGVMIALFLRADRRIDEVEARSDSRFDKVDARFDKMDSKFESRFEKMDSDFGSRFDKVDARFEKMDSKFGKMDSKFDFMAQDIVEIKVSVARIEGYLQARDGYAPGGRDRPASRPDVDQPPGGYRQTG